MTVAWHSRVLGLLPSDCEQNGSGCLACTDHGFRLVRGPGRRRVGLDMAQGQGRFLLLQRPCLPSQVTRPILQSVVLLLCPVTVRSEPRTMISQMNSRTKRQNQQA